MQTAGGTSTEDLLHKFSCSGITTVTSGETQKLQPPRLSSVEQQVLTASPLPCASYSSLLRHEDMVALPHTSCSSPYHLLNGCPDHGVPSACIPIPAFCSHPFG